MLAAIIGLMMIGCKNNQPVETAPIVINEVVFTEEAPSVNLEEVVRVCISTTHHELYEEQTHIKHNQCDKFSKCWTEIAGQSRSKCGTSISAKYHASNDEVNKIIWQHPQWL